MNIIMENKKEKRNQYEEMLKNVPEGCRIHIDKNELEQLLFDEFEFYDGLTVKLPVWSGTFLRKIDLSEVNFEGVSWYFLNDNGLTYDNFEVVYFDIENAPKNYYEEKADEFCERFEDVMYKTIDYSGTNAKIDFTKAFEYDCTHITNCNFSNVDLSNNTISGYFVCDCNFANSGINIPSSDAGTLIDNNFSGVDFSEFTFDIINGGLSVDSIDTGFECFGNNFANTRINLILDFKSTEYPFRSYESILKEFENGYYEGCAINGQVFNSITDQINYLNKLFSAYINHDVSDTSYVTRETIKEKRLYYKTNYPNDYYDIPKHRTHIDKEELEQLLFDEFEFYDGLTVKLPVWSGNFLKYIDLSEISFDNVSWYFLNDNGLTYDNFEVIYRGIKDIPKGYYKKKADEFRECFKDVMYKPVNYSGTNAKIDFTNAFKHDDSKITNCDFSNVDLYGNTLSKDCFISECNFSHSNIGISKDAVGTIIDSSFSGLYLDNFTFNLITQALYYDGVEINKNNEFEHINLLNTGMKIIFDPEDFNTFGDDYNDILDNAKKGFYDGCYINGILFGSTSSLINYLDELYTDYINSTNKVETEQETNDINYQILDKNILENARQLFASARELCPGMDESMYYLTDYISTFINDRIAPIGIVLIIPCIMYDLENGTNGFNQSKLPDNLVNNKNRIMNQIMYLPQIVDAIADKQFAEDFRNICRESFNIDPAKRVNLENKTNYPENILTAVNWWVDAIQSPVLDNGDLNMSSPLMMTIFGKHESYSEEELQKFKDELANQIINTMQENGDCQLYVDYDPCDELYFAAQKLGEDKYVQFPWKTRMYISNDQVEVMPGYHADKIILWSNQNVSQDGDEPVHR